MINIMIYSRCHLFTMALNLIIKKTEKISLEKKINIRLHNCSSIEELRLFLTQYDNIFIIIDIDDIFYLNRSDFFSKIRKMAPNISIFTFCSESKESWFHRALSFTSDQVVSKKENVNTIESEIACWLFDKKNKQNILLSDVITSYYDSLSKREKETFKYLLSGLSNMEIATILSLSNKTVSFYRRNIFCHFGVRNIVELYLMLSYQKRDHLIIKKELYCK